MKNATPYLTAEALSIQPWEYDGLVALIGPLSCDIYRLKMNYENGIHNCGTVHCIGGWVAVLAGQDAASYVGSYSGIEDPINNLYYPKTVAGWRATAPQAARAIVNFLMTGDPKWDDVMRDGSAP